MIILINICIIYLINVVWFIIYCLLNHVLFYSFLFPFFRDIETTNSMLNEMLDFMPQETGGNNFCQILINYLVYFKVYLS